MISAFIEVSFYVDFFFFFKQKTAYEMRISDWSSDVCSSDLASRSLPEQGRHNGNGDRRPRLTSLAGRVGRLLPLLAVAALAACAGGYKPVSDTPVKIGRPYTVRGTTYTPAADPRYDMLGYARWSGNESGDRKSTRLNYSNK